jgi:hypothetical protein
MAQAGLKFKILLLQPPKCWDYRLAPLYPAETAFSYFTFRKINWYSF